MDGFSVNGSEPSIHSSYGSFDCNRHDYPEYRGKDNYHELSPLMTKPCLNPYNKSCCWRWVALATAVTFLVAVFPAQKEFFFHPDNSLGYEYIVVGGGPSGILVATKLARRLTGKVLLLEAGTASQSSVLSTLNQDTEDTLRLNKFDIPLLWSGVASSKQQDHLDSSSSHQWPMTTMLLSRALGGGGLINAMIYVRSLPQDFVRWNMAGWTWEKILPHYTNLETYDDSNYETPHLYQNQNASSDRGQNGPITTVPAGLLDVVAPLFVESLVASGWPLAARGFNDPEKRVGGGYYDFNIRNGVRHSVAEALLGGWNSKLESPRNLDIMTGAIVDRVLFKDTKAVGVEYRKDGTVRRTFLGNHLGEVIVACGAILTPQLLANSGISDGGTVSNLPGVGKNLQDHPVVGLAFELASEIAEQANSVYSVASDMEEYFVSVETLKNMATSKKGSSENRKSAFAGMGAFATSGFSAGAFLTSPWANASVADIQLTVFPCVEEPHIIRKELEIGVLPRSSMLVTVALLDPEARYEVVPYRNGVPVDPERVIMKPDGNNPFADWYFLPSVALPVGKSTYLTPHDVRRIAWGVSEVRRILSHAPLSSKTGREVYPGASVLGGALNNHIYANHLPNAHWVGSARMGTDRLSVVDEELRVHGTQGLRVVDASIMPHVPNGNTHSTVCVVASRAADLIFSARLRK